MTKRKKEILKPFVKTFDRVLSNQKLRRGSTRVAKAFIDRYTSHGTDVLTSSKRHFNGPWEFMLDTPKLEKTGDKKAYISGWFVPHQDIKVSIRVVYPSGKTLTVRSDIKRFDVAETLSERLKREVNTTCGFGKTVLINEDGAYSIEAKLGSVWKKLCTFKLRYDPDFIVSDIFNGNLAYNYAAHVNLINSKKQFFYEKEKDAHYLAGASDTKLIAFYLPQFHPFKENNEWWGKGFTEWSNVASASPRYVGHEQPKLPADLGFYDLRIEKNIKLQIDMAKKHGLHGFCFYYYWFSGRKLMETPLKALLKNKEWDFNFMICWANENWTRRWDGRNQDVLIAQEHRDTDALDFIKDVESILLDRRYIRVDGKPALMVYRAEDLKGTNDYVKQWRDYFKKHHNTDLHLIMVQSFSADDPASHDFDKGLEFAPLTISSSLKKDIPRYDIADKILDVEFTGAMYDYRPIALSYYKRTPQFNAYRSVMPRWDNDARRKGNGGVFANADPDLYGHWLSNIIGQTNNTAQTNDQKLVFINAWNEWAEGAFLEPDTMYGHAYLNRTAEVLAAHSENPANRDRFPLYGIKRTKEVTLAIVVHLFYPEMWQDFQKHIKNLDPEAYDLFVTIPKKAKHVERDILKFNKNAQIITMPNRGRDVLPFLHLARRLKELGYEKFLKIHSKKSAHRHDGNLWINDMLKRLIPKNMRSAKELLDALDQKDTGIIGPYGHYISLDAYYGSNKDKTLRILKSTIGDSKTKVVINKLSENGFFAGTMFWGRFDAIEAILDQFYQASDFEPEAGQIDGTFAHAAERALTLVPRALGKNIYATDGGKVMTITAQGLISSNYAFAKNKSKM